MSLISKLRRKRSTGGCPTWTPTTTHPLRGKYSHQQHNWILIVFRPRTSPNHRFPPSQSPTASLVAQAIRSPTLKHGYLNNHKSYKDAIKKKNALNVHAVLMAPGRKLVFNFGMPARHARMGKTITMVFYGSSLSPTRRLPTN
jgi:hypothetical protein